MEADRAENGVGTEMIQAVYEAWQAKPDRWSLPVAWFAIGLASGSLWACIFWLIYWLVKG